MSDFVQVGCMRCKRSRGLRVRKTLDSLLGPAFDRLQAEAAKNGINIPDDFHAKMEKWCRKRGLITTEDEPVIQEPLLKRPENLD